MGNNGHTKMMKNKDPSNKIRMKPRIRGRQTVPVSN